ncbi:hypothetical protein ACLI4Z_00615 [Natrialbaceae archaeon A-arb3/5]
MPDVLPGTAERVPTSTDEAVNERLRRELGERLQYYAEHPDEIETRLVELEREWDVERMLEANASALILLCLGLGATVDRRLVAVPAVVAGFLLQPPFKGGARRFPSSVDWESERSERSMPSGPHSRRFRKLAISNLSALTCGFDRYRR